MSTACWGYTGLEKPRHGARRAAMWSGRRLERQLRWSSCGRKNMLARAFPCERGPSAQGDGLVRRRRVGKVAEPASDPLAGAFEDHDRVARKMAYAGQ